MGVGLRPSDAGWGRGRQPVVNVSWADASALAAALSRLTSERYRLPSESEWEYACRAGSRGPFCFREPISPQLANYDASQAFDGGAAGRSRGRTVEVGTFPPNAYGLFDMHGNVREWVQDAWHDDYHGAPGDGLAWSTGHSAMHVVRGGGWLDPPWLLRSTARGRGAKSDRANFIGFRLARDLG
jgi:formylglycine-generating enzyme required for sulfatase activity